MKNMSKRVVEYLQHGDEGDYVLHMSRMVEITNMCGGRYLCYDDGIVSVQTSDASVACAFLLS